MEKFPKNLEQTERQPETAEKEANEYNYEHIALMEGVFLDQARKNPDIKLIDLDEAMAGIEHGAGISLGDAEKKILERATLNYKDARHQMLKLLEDGDFEKIGRDKRGDILNGEKLYELLTGARPGAGVYAQFLPFAVYIRCDKSSDFGFLYGAIVPGGESGLQSQFDKIKIMQEKSSGVATHFQYSNPDTKVPLIVENSEIYSGRPEEFIEKTRNYLIIHEEQHIINHFFADALFFDKSFADQKLVDAVGKKVKKEMLGEKFGMEDVRENLAVYADKLRKQFLRNAQNEITAYLKEGCTPQEISGFLKQRGGIYDYFMQNRNILAADFKKFFGGYAEEFLAYVQAEFYNGYDKEIDMAVNLCDKLLVKYQVQEIVGNLNVVPVWKWKETTEKMLNKRR